MSKKSKLEAPALPTDLNLAAFIRQDQVEPKVEPTKTFVVTIKLPDSIRRELKVRLAQDGRTLQDVGQAAFEKYLRS